MIDLQTATEGRDERDATSSHRHQWLSAKPINQVHSQPYVERRHKGNWGIIFHKNQR